MRPHHTLRVPIEDTSSVHEARRVARRLAQAMEFTPARVEQIVICASELATNIDKHTRGGAIYLQPTPGSAARDLELLSVDDGPGAEPFERLLTDGYTTTGTLGAGLGAVRRMASRFVPYSQSSRGTVVYARFRPEPGPSAPGVEPVEMGALCLPAHGQEVSGDAYRILDDERDLALLIVDGLGHGAEAARASHRALAMLQHPADVSPAAVLSAVHQGLLGTRGAAAAAVRVDLRRGRGEFCGIGNISGVVLAGGTLSSQRLGSRPGTLGLKIPRPQSQPFALPPQGILLLHTDGIRARWDLAQYSGLLAQPTTVLAAVLVRDFWRARDDATVMALRPRPMLRGDRTPWAQA